MADQGETATQVNVVHKLLVQLQRKRNEKKSLFATYFEITKEDYAKECPGMEFCNHLVALAACYWSVSDVALY